MENIRYSCPRSHKNKKDKLGRFLLRRIRPLSKSTHVWGRETYCTSCFSDVKSLTARATTKQNKTIPICRRIFDVDFFSPSRIIGSSIDRLSWSWTRWALVSTSNPYGSSTYVIVAPRPAPAPASSVNDALSRPVACISNATYAHCIPSPVPTWVNFTGAGDHDEPSSSADDDSSPHVDQDVIRQRSSPTVIVHDDSLFADAPGALDCYVLTIEQQISRVDFIPPTFQTRRIRRAQHVRGDEVVRIDGRQCN